VAAVVSDRALLTCRPAGSAADDTAAPAGASQLRNRALVVNEYDGNGRVSKETQADNSRYLFAYTLDGLGKVTEAQVTDPHDQIRRVTFNTSGYTVSQTQALDTTLARTTTLTWQMGTNLLLSLTDPLSRKTAYTYDAMGNRTSVTRLAETSNAVTTSVTYESTFNQVASITDPNHVTSFEYAFDHTSLASRTCWSSSVLQPQPWHELRYLASSSHRPHTREGRGRNRVAG